MRERMRAENGGEMGGEEREARGFERDEKSLFQALKSPDSLQIMLFVCLLLLFFCKSVCRLAIVSFCLCGPCCLN